MSVITFTPNRGCIRLTEIILVQKRLGDINVLKEKKITFLIHFRTIVLHFKIYDTSVTAQLKSP